MDNLEYYAKLKKNPTKEFKKNWDEQLSEWQDINLLDEDEVKYLRTEFPITATIYFLPKIHKHATKPPGRLIIAANGSLLEPAANYVDFFLLPFVQNLTSYIKDTSDLLRHTRHPMAEFL